MRKTLILSGLFIILGGASGVISAQTAATKTTTPANAADAKQKLELATGDVSSIGGGKILLQTKEGASVEIVLSEKTEYKRLSPDSPSLKTATAGNLSDIGVGDKLVVTGVFSADRKTMPGQKVFLVTKSDIAQKQKKELAEWSARGITGQVAAVNAQTKEITVSARTFAGERKTVLTAKDNADIRRYAADSVDYNEAKNGSFADIKVGDSIRALGEKSEDGATLKAEKIVTGSFQTVGGTITAIDAAKNEITINNVQTKKPLTIALGKNSVLKQFPAEMAQRMAQMQTMQSSGGAMPAGGGNNGQGGGMVRPPRGANQTGGGEANAGQNRTGQGGFGGGGMRGGNIDDMLERFQTIAITDLKVGDMIAVSSTKSAGDSCVNAIKLLSGVEPFLKAAQQTAGRTGGGRGGQDTGFQIPGLEGSNFP